MALNWISRDPIAGPLEDLFSARTSPHAEVWRARFDIEKFDPRDKAIWKLLGDIRLTEATRKRQAEFCAGRHLASKVLNLEKPLPRARDGAPVWPAGYRGALSHGGDLVLLLAGSAHRRLGVDVEPLLSPISCQAVLARVLRSNEHRLMSDLGDRELVRVATLMFSAKETLFKALSSESIGKPGFAVSEVLELPRKGRPLSIRLTRALGKSLPAGRTFEIGYDFVGTHVITWLDLPR